MKPHQPSSGFCRHWRRLYAQLTVGDTGAVRRSSTVAAVMLDSYRSNRTEPLDAESKEFVDAGRLAEEVLAA